MTLTVLNAGDEDRLGDRSDQGSRRRVRGSRRLAAVAVDDAVAVSVDLLALMLGPFGWTFADEILDVVAAALLWRLIGFHPLLLPTFVVELVPVIDMIPTWTGCVAAVVALRRKDQRRLSGPPPGGTVIDV